MNIVSYLADYKKEVMEIQSVRIGTYQVSSRTVMCKTLHIVHHSTNPYTLQCYDYTQGPFFVRLMTLVSPYTVSHVDSQRKTGKIS